MPVPTLDRIRCGRCPRIPAVASIFLPMLLLAACGREFAPDAGREAASVPPPQATAATPPVDDETDAAAAGSDTLGGDGSTIRLDALTAQDVADAELPGELSCGFLHEGASLLHASGMVASDDPALGIVKVSGVVEQVRAPGGYDGMLDSPTFSGRGLTLRVRTTGPATGGGESPPRPATLTYLRGDGASQSFEGQWQCGP